MVGKGRGFSLRGLRDQKRGKRSKRSKEGKEIKRGKKYSRRAGREKERLPVSLFP